MTHATTHATMQRIFDATGKSPTEIAVALKTSPQNVNNWINRGISKGGAVDASSVFGLSVDWILKGQGEMTAKPTPADLQTKIHEIEGKANGLERAKPVKILPIINEVQAGQFTEIGDNQFDEYEPAHHKDGTYWLRVKGDSMTPDFVQGDLILVGRERVASTGNYVVALLENDPKATFKKYRECFENGERYHELIALNSFYPPIDSRIKPFEIIGVVLEHKRVLV